MNATAWLETTDAELETLTNTDPHVVKTCSRNDGWWQGDLGIQYLGEGKPMLDLVKVKTPTQLAEGNTRGSRHMLEFDPDIEAYTLRNSNPLVGYVLHCPNGLTVTHPEHGDITICEAGWYGIRYQRQHAEELRRAMD